MARLLYGSFQSDDARIHYYRTGELKPPLILLHGLTDNGLCWNQIPMLLEVEYDVIMPDARGHGVSQVGAQPVTMDLMALDVLRLIEELQLKQPVIMGHSMGADVAARVAARSPKLIRGLVLEDPPWFENDALLSTAEASSDLARRRAWIQEFKALSLEELMALGRKENPAWDESEFSQWARSKHQFNLALLDQLAPSEPWRQVAARLTCPGLVLSADPQHGALITPEVGRQIEKAWKKGRVVQIPGAGHSIHREQFVASYRELDGFLKKLGKWKP